MSVLGKPLYLSRQLRALEQQFADTGLMERAGLAIAALAQELLKDSADPVLVIVGPGNNGGDALVAARHLKARWYRVIVVLAGEPSRMPRDASAAYMSWVAAGGSVQTTMPDGRFGLVIDGLFGIGLQRQLTDEHIALVDHINRLQCPVLSIDIPSGLHADSGRVLGCAVRATHTLTMLGLKPGLYTLDGPDYAGEVHCCDLGITTSSVPANTVGRLIPAEILSLLPRRRLNSHKGLFGNTAVLGGAEGMAGAVLLAARAALLSGSGRVYGGFLAPAVPVFDPLQPELMLRNGTGIAGLDKLSCVILGPGLGQSQAACELLEYWLTQEVPLLLDADALNLLAAHPQLQQAMRQRGTPSIITPHPLEAARLLASDITDIQGDRIASAQQLAQRYNTICVLKGAGSICAAADGSWHINTSGNPGLASAGTGDVLSGIIGSLVAQGMSALDAARAGAYLHGAAADLLVRQGIGPVGLAASELAGAVRHLINQYQQED